MQPVHAPLTKAESNGQAIPVGYANEAYFPTKLRESEWKLEEIEERDIKSGGDLTWTDAKNGIINYCSPRRWRQRIPISYWLPKYSLLDFKGDMIAGLTVGLTVVPQGLAYAAIAQVPLECGLYSAFMGCFMYTLFGTAKDITLGPTAVLSLMTAAAFPKGASLNDRAHYAVILSFLSGICQVFLSIFNLGFLVNFISAPVISGFTTASAFIILYGQIKTLTGIKFNADSVVEHTIGYWRNVQNINGYDTLMGMISLTVLLLMKDLKLSRKPRFNISKKMWNILREVVRIVCVTRYAMVIIIATGIGYYLNKIVGFKGLSITNDVNVTVPALYPPQFTWGNHTGSEAVLLMLPSVPMIVLVGALESIAVAKAFAFQFQYVIQPTQELMALGLSNILCSFLKGYPVTGSFTRSALKAQCGVRTPLGCTWTGAFVLLAMAVIAPAFKYVPKSALSAVIIAAILILFEFKIFKDLWLINKKELFTMITVIVVAFTVSVDAGILAGIGVSMLLLLFPIARPAILAHFQDSYYSLSPRAPRTGKRTIFVDVTPQGALFFPAAEYLKDFFQEHIVTPQHNETMKVIPQDPQPLELKITEIKEEVVFNGIHLTDSDYTSLRAIRSAVQSCITHKKQIRFINTPPSILRIVLPKEMRATYTTEQIPPDNNVSAITFSQSTAERAASVSVEAFADMQRAETTKSHLSEQGLFDEEERFDFEENRRNPPNPMNPSKDEYGLRVSFSR